MSRTIDLRALLTCLKSRGSSYWPVRYALRLCWITEQTRQMNCALMFSRNSGSLIPFIFGPEKYLRNMSSGISCARNRFWSSCHKLAARRQNLVRYLLGAFVFGRWTDPYPKVPQFWKPFLFFRDLPDYICQVLFVYFHKRGVSVSEIVCYEAAILLTSAHVFIMMNYTHVSAGRNLSALVSNSPWACVQAFSSNRMVSSPFGSGFWNNV